MAGKPEAAPPAKTEAAPAAAAEAPAPKKGIAPMIPLIAVIVLAPALSFAVGQFVLMPQLKKELATPVDPNAPAAEEPAEAPAEAPAGGEKGGKKGEPTGAPNTYEFSNIVVNLAGTMGTRYLKTTFIVTGSDKSLRGAFEANKPKLLDVTLNVLSSLSLTDLEEAGSKNIIREKLIAAYNQALGKRLAEQVYFSDFVVQ
jgi:flagellar protein FliL